MFHEADLIAMPACTEGFGVKQFQPTSMPVLVFGE